MNTITFFEGRALVHQDVTVRYGRRGAVAAAFFPATVLFVVLAVQLFVRILVVERAYGIESMRTSALSNDTKLRELHAKYAELLGPALVAGRAKSELGFEPLPPQRIRKFVIDG